MKTTLNLFESMLSRRELLPLLAHLGFFAVASHAVAATDDEGIDSITMTVGDLTATIGTNSPSSTQRPGYNGVWSLQHSKNRTSIFVPGISGLNLEHIVNGSALTNDDLFFEPRRNPMGIRQLNQQSVELHQPTTPHTGIESWTTFTLAPPHYLDMHFKFKATVDIFPNNYLLFFWASYINAPLDKSIYFLGSLEGQTPQWQQLCTQYHNDQSTIRYRDDTRKLQFAEDGRTALFKNLSPLRFAEPLIYGNIDNLTWCVLFDNPQDIRITHSPSGGGGNASQKTSNPAWDFQWIIDSPKIEQMYDLNIRTILRPTCSRNDILKELAIWKKEHPTKSK